MNPKVMPAQNDAPVCAPPDFSPRRPQLVFPPNACDCHAHILGPLAQHPYSPQRIYTPPDCLLPDYRRMLGTLGINRAVLVQPSVYGTDNTVLLQALRQGGASFRGVAVVDAGLSPEALEAMHAAGVRGVRVNIVDVKAGAGVLPMAQLTQLAQRVAPLGWHMEFLLHVDEFPELDRALADFPVPTVFGHLGYMAVKKGLDAPGFQALLRLLHSGRSWVKLSGPYRIAQGGLPYAGVAEVAQTLLKTAPAQVVWGSDWPHVMVKGKMPNDGELADLLGAWVADDKLRHQVLVGNPARLYGF